MCRVKVTGRNSFREDSSYFLKAGDLDKNVESKSLKCCQRTMGIKIIKDLSGGWSRHTHIIECKVSEIYTKLAVGNSSKERLILSWGYLSIHVEKVQLKQS